MHASVSPGLNEDSNCKSSPVSTLFAALDALQFPKNSKMCPARTPASTPWKGLCPLCSKMNIPHPQISRRISPWCRGIMQSCRPYTVAIGILSLHTKGKMGSVHCDRVHETEMCSPTTLSPQDARKIACQYTASKASKPNKRQSVENTPPPKIPKFLADCKTENLKNTPQYAPLHPSVGNIPALSIKSKCETRCGYRHANTDPTKPPKECPATNTRVNDSSQRKK